MGNFFRRFVRGTQKTSTQFIKLVSNRKKLSKFFHSKNVELVIIILLAITIPLTVLGLQQIQDIREHAATTTPTPGSRAASPTVDNDPDNPNNNLPMCGSAGKENFVVSPSQPVQGDKVTFSFKDGSTVDNIINGFGNGVIANTCVQSGASVTCTARGNYTCAANKPNCTAKTTGISTHTWFTLPGGAKVDNCQYKVKKASAPIGAGGGGTSACRGLISPVCDTGNGKKPGLQLRWQMDKSTTCKLLVKKTTGSTQQIIPVDCGKTATLEKTIYNIGSDPVNDNVTYQLILQSDNNSCNNVTKGTAQPQCHPVNQLTPTSTPKAGTGTSTPTPTGTRTGNGSPTPTIPNEPSGCTQKDVHLDQAGTSCTANNNIRLTGGWNLSGTNCTVTLYENGVEKDHDNNCQKNAWNYDSISAGKKYQIKGKSNKCTAAISSIEVTAKACTGATATPTPSKTPTPTPRSATATPTPGVCPAGTVSNGTITASTFDPTKDCVTPTPTRCPGGQCF